MHADVIIIIPTVLIHESQRRTRRLRVRFPRRRRQHAQHRRVIPTTDAGASSACEPRGHSTKTGKKKDALVVDGH